MARGIPGKPCQDFSARCNILSFGPNALFHRVIYFLIYARTPRITSTCISIEFLPPLSLSLRANSLNRKTYQTGEPYFPSIGCRSHGGIPLSDIQTVDRSYLDVKRKSFDSLKRFPPPPSI